MGSLDKARETQLHNIETKTGKTLVQLRSAISGSGLTKHSEIRELLINTYGLGYGDANALVHYALESDGQSAARAMQASGATLEDVVSEIYADKKASLRPIHEMLMKECAKWGDFEIVPKKGYVSLRRKKQFAMLGPKTGYVELGLNMKGVEPSARLAKLPEGGMCQYRVKVTDIAEVNAELLDWIKRAFDNAN